MSLSLSFPFSACFLPGSDSDCLSRAARVIADQVILTRQWVTDCMGGVFVNTRSTGAQGVIYATPDQIITETETFQMFTPSMVTAKLSQHSFEKKAYQFRLSSLTPINRKNQPNRFEKTALMHFQHSNTSEFYQYTDQTLEYMVPLHQKQGCAKCHENKAGTASRIIGGLRITLPFDEVKKTVRKNVILLAGTGAGVTLVTILVLVFLIHRLVLNPINELENKSRQLSKGDLTARVNLGTHDELARLGSSFNLMAESLMHSQDFLEEKVAKATSDLARANHELLRLDRLKSDFLANMSHELRTPLTAVKGSINYLERTVQEPDQQEFIQIIEKNISRVTRLISNLFDFTRLEAGTIEWEFENEDISQLVTEVVEILAPLALDKRIDVQCTCPEGIYAVIDLERMEQVLVNILENAIKFSDKDSRIEVAVIPSADRVAVSVKDYGPGIAEEHIETIFKKFYTVSSRTDRKNQGAGMGMAISKAIVSAHNGTLTVESEENRFSIFTVTLPAG